MVLILVPCCLEKLDANYGRYFYFIAEIWWSLDAATNTSELKITEVLTEYKMADISLPKKKNYSMMEGATLLQWKTHDKNLFYMIEMSYLNIVIIILQPGYLRRKRRRWITGSWKNKKGIYFSAKTHAGPVAEFVEDHAILNNLARVLDRIAVQTEIPIKNGRSPYPCLRIDVFGRFKQKTGNPWFAKRQT